MGKIAQLVLGPAGSGKSTYCAAMQRHISTSRDGRVCHVINLDPAAESFEYTPSVDIRDLVTVDDVMEFTDLGPNGGLVYAMEYVITEDDWFETVLGDYEEDYILFDCPGQVELYTHYPVFTKLARVLESHGYRVVSIYLVELSKISISTILDSICAQAALGLPHLCIASKADLVPERDRVDTEMLCMESIKKARGSTRRLTEALMGLLETFSMPYFDILDLQEEDTVTQLLEKIDMVTQYDEDAEPREPKDMDEYDGELDMYADAGDENDCGLGGMDDIDIN